MDYLIVFALGVLVGPYVIDKAKAAVAWVKSKSED